MKNKPRAAAGFTLIELHVRNAAHALCYQEGGAASFFGNGNCWSNNKEFRAPVPGIF